MRKVLLFLIRLLARSLYAKTGPTSVLNLCKSAVLPYLPFKHITVDVRKTHSDALLLIPLFV